MFLVMHGIKEKAALLQLFLDVLAVNQHKVTEELILILVHFGRHWEDQAQRHEQGARCYDQQVQQSSFNVVRNVLTLIEDRLSTGLNGLQDVIKGVSEHKEDGRLIPSDLAQRHFLDRQGVH